jgi:hypothetical protein
MREKKTSVKKYIFKIRIRVFSKPGIFVGQKKSNLPDVDVHVKIKFLG